MNKILACSFVEASMQLAELHPSVSVVCEIQLPCGHKFPVDPPDVPLYVADPIGFCALHFKISLAQFQAWLSYIDGDHHCTGTTKKGLACGAFGEGDIHPSCFILGVSDRCVHHIDLDEAALHQPECHSI